jgi:hypothetical protein
MRATEHILLESDSREVPSLCTARKVHAQLRLLSTLRRRAAELTLIDNYFLAVRLLHAERVVSQYVLDLRFVDAELRRTRHVAWGCIALSATLLTLAAAIGLAIRSAPNPWWQHEWLRALSVSLVLAACSTLAAIYRTTETLTLRSVCGQARLLEFTGGLGTFRALRRFGTTLSAHLRLARSRRRSSRAEHLRDEMREHFRLRDAGVLSETEYESSKVRILASHVSA